MAPASGAPARMTGIGWLAVALPTALFAWFATMLPEITAGETVRVAWAWAPGLDVQLSFVVDGLSLLFALLITGIGAFVFLYSAVYLAGDRQLNRFLLILTLFMLSMLGLVLADNLIALFVFWELTTVTSYLLIGFHHEQLKARKLALQALVVTGAGGLAFLAGVILLGVGAGSFEISEINAQGGAFTEHALYLPVLILILLGTFTKSAQFPFHFWLPNAMAAPSPVSAYLHSATMVKAGVFVMARLHPTLGGTEVWMWTLTIVGAITAVWASILALRQTDIKLMMAYTTLMALGTLTLFLGAESELAITAVATFILVHSLYKAALFLIVGIVDHQAGTRELPELGGLRTVLPVTFVASVLASLSMAGFPPFIGFIGKELKYKGALAVATEPTLVVIAAVAANAMMVAVALIMAFKVFLGPRNTPKAVLGEAPWPMLAGPLVLAILGTIFGMAPGLTAEPLIHATVTAIRAVDSGYELELWHGINVPLILSIITVALGGLLYWKIDRLRPWLAERLDALPVSGDGAFDRTMAGILGFARWQAGVLQNGVQRRYIFTVYLTLVVLVAGTLWIKGGVVLPRSLPDLQFYKWATIAMIVAATGITVLTNSRMLAICALGVVGTSIALLFVMYGAPDVAMTQLMVEVLVVVIVSLVLVRLPGFKGEGHDSRLGRWRDGLLAVGVGGTISVLMLAVTAGDLDRTIPAFFAEASYPEALGRNIVNVILVDFRAIDTFGEIAVVAVAGLACYALIKLRPQRPPGTAAAAPVPPQPPTRTAPVGGDD